MKNLALYVSVSAEQHKRIKSIERRSARHLGKNIPGNYIISEYLHPMLSLLIENIITQAEKDLDEMDLITADRIWFSA